MDTDAILRQRIEKLVGSICNLQPQLQTLADAFRVGLNANETPDFDKWSSKEWCKNAFGNAMIRLRQLTENNFHFVETMGLLAVARYIFELSVWLHLLNTDSRFGLVYYEQLLDTQLRYYRDSVEHLRREVELLKSFEKKDKRATDAVLKSELRTIGADVGAALSQAMSAVDAEASRKFSLYLDSAKTNGYGFQAYLVEKKAIPQAEEAVRQIEQEIEEFRRRVPQEVKDLAKGRWQWKQMAQRVGLGAEHDYIYSYASKLLHATPASLTTDQKNLELQEVYIFLRYIYAKLLEMMELAKRQPECRITIKA